MKKPIKTKVERVASFNTIVFSEPKKDTYIFLDGIEHTFGLQDVIPKNTVLQKGDAVSLIKIRNGKKIIKQ